MLLLFAILGLAYLYFGRHGSATNSPANDSSKPGSAQKNNVILAQPISYQAVQGFAVGSQESPSYRKRFTEGNRVNVQQQQLVLKGASSSAGTNRVVADLWDRLSSTFDPQWRMRYARAYHRMSLQKDVDEGRQPQGDLNVDRFTEEVNNDTGEASGFTRTQYTYQQRYTRGKPRMGAGPNAKRKLDQEDPGDTTNLQTTLNPNGQSSVIYPSLTTDRNGTAEPWPGVKIVNLERDFWAKNGRPYNPVGSTQEAMPVHKGWSWASVIPPRNKQGSHQRPRSIPSRSNPQNNDVNSGQGTG
jgi:hypothetical protein